MFILVPAYPGCPGQTAVKWLLLFGLGFLSIYLGLAFYVFSICVDSFLVLFDFVVFG